MKKFLLILMCAYATFSASAVELSFWLGNKKITPGQTVQFTDITTDLYTDYKEVTMKPALYISSDIFSSDVKITAKCTSGQSIQMCAGGTCRGGVTVTKDQVTVRPNQKLDLGFDYIGELDLDEAIPTVVTVFEAEDIYESDSKVTFVLEMGEKSASVSVIEAFDDLKAVDGGIAYKADEATQLNVAAISGVNVFSATVSGEGFIALPAGIYVYSFGERTGKLYVR